MTEKITETTKVYIRKTNKGRTPVYATAGSAGCDLFASGQLILLPGQTRVLPLDITIALEPGVEAQIRPRSGLSLRTALRLPNSPGTIDSDYRDPVGVLLHNTFRQMDIIDKILAEPACLQELARDYRKVTYAAWLSARTKQDELPVPEFIRDLPLYLDANDNPYGTIYIQPGERVAQMVFTRHLRADFLDHPEPENIGRNRGGGFGSTGGHADLTP